MDVLRSSSLERWLRSMAPVLRVISSPSAMLLGALECKMVSVLFMTMSLV